VITVKIHHDIKNTTVIEKIKYKINHRRKLELCRVDTESVTSHGGNAAAVLADLACNTALQHHVIH